MAALSAQFLVAGPVMAGVVAPAAGGPQGADRRAHDYAIGDLRIEHPYARPTPPGATTAGAYFTIRNAGARADRLLRVSSPVAQSTELHSMTMDGAMMRMRAIAALDIPAGARVSLADAGYHVMMTGLRQPLSPGTRVPLTLTFDRSGSIAVYAVVETAVASASASRRN